MDVDWTLFFSVVALAMVLEAIPYIVVPGKMHRILSEMIKFDPCVLRRYGLVMLGCGVLLLFIVRRVMA